MVDLGKHSVLGIMVNAIDYEAATSKIINAAVNRASYSVTALAVHGVMTGVTDPEHKYRLNNFDLVVPDGQPVRWNLNFYNKLHLKNRVYGPQLTLKVCQAAEASALPIYFYGSQSQVLEQLCFNLKKKFPKLVIAGSMPSKFRQTTQDERLEIVEEIKRSGARLVFVGLGCPKQEVWVYEYREYLDMPLLAVGAAFDFHAGLLPQAPEVMQKTGTEWLYRLWQEPRRLWKRYIYLNSLYIFYNTICHLMPSRFLADNCKKPLDEILYG